MRSLPRFPLSGNLNKMRSMLARAACSAAMVLALSAPALSASLLNLTITTAQTAQVGAVLQFRNGLIPRNATVLCAFTYGSGGTSADAYVQTSVDLGTTWIDVVECGFTTSSAKKAANLSSQTPVTTLYTPTDGALAANTAKDGIIGSSWRAKYTTVGTYAGSTKLIVSVAPGNLSP